VHTQQPLNAISRRSSETPLVLTAMVPAHLQAPTAEGLVALLTTAPIEAVATLAQSGVAVEVEAGLSHHLLDAVVVVVPQGGAGSRMAMPLEELRQARAEPLRLAAVQPRL